MLKNVQVLVANLTGYVEDMGVAAPGHEFQPLLYMDGSDNCKHSK